MDQKSFVGAYVRFDGRDNCEPFLSVTPGFELGPGIQRDGLAKPYMTDPQGVAYVCQAREVACRPSQHTTSPFVQRLGTWTIYDHLAHFAERMGKDGWRIVGVQGHGDLTMNYWHVAYLNQPGLDERPVFCRLSTDEDGQAREPIRERWYRCLVKWRSPHTPQIEVRDVQFRQGRTVSVRFKGDERDVSSEIALAMSGKTLIENGAELPLNVTLEKFDDLRHVFHLPELTAVGVHEGRGISKANLGEHDLFRDLNLRRAALTGPLVISLAPTQTLSFDMDSLENGLTSKGFRPTPANAPIPSMPGEYRIHRERRQIEIFFPRNVYPFGVLGVKVGSADNPHPNLICLGSGGFSGQMGNTLEGISRIMFNFLGCTDAMVLDEGLDVFQIVNPFTDKRLPRFSNQEIVNAAARVTHNLILNENRMAEGRGEVPPARLALNEASFAAAAKAAAQAPAAPEPTDLFTVLPQRSQIRAVLVFAVKA